MTWRGVATFRTQKGCVVTVGDAASTHVLSPFSLRSLFVPLHVFLGRARFLLRSGGHVRAIRGFG